MLMYLYDMPVVILSFFRYILICFNLHKFKLISDSDYFYLFEKINVENGLRIIEVNSQFILLLILNFLQINIQYFHLCTISLENNSTKQLKNIC